MKRAVVRTLLAFALATTLIAPAGAAHAAGAGVCEVTGNVDLGAPLNGNGRDSTYNFTSTKLQCTGTADISGVWFTYASGHTTGILAGGETCAHGKSKGNGAVSATSGARSLEGTMRFNRAGSVVQVGGNLTSVYDGQYYLFTGVLQLTPNPLTDARHCTSEQWYYGITRFALMGVVTLVTAD